MEMKQFGRAPWIRHRIRHRIKQWRNQVFLDGDANPKVGTPTYFFGQFSFVKWVPHFTPTTCSCNWRRNPHRKLTYLHQQDVNDTTITTTPHGGTPRSDNSLSNSDGVLDPTPGTTQPCAINLL